MKENIGIHITFISSFKKLYAFWSVFRLDPKLFERIFFQFPDGRILKNIFYILLVVLYWMRENDPHYLLILE